MKEKVIRIKDKKCELYSFEYEGNEYKYEIQEPTFDQIKAALSQIKTGGQMDVIGSGKVIWELCCTKYDPYIEKTPKLLIAVCMELANEYALPIDLEIKKK